MSKADNMANSCRSVVPHNQTADNDDADDPDHKKAGSDADRTLVIRSQAVVKLQTHQTPGAFARLQCNTDLNTPPSNWLTSAANTYGLQQALTHTAGFSSFRMAHMFPDCLGEIDVVTSAENIKKILKLPYSTKSGISLMIHRIENTLLIDDFDIYKYLLRQADDDWMWLRSFIYEHILTDLDDGERRLFVKNRSRAALQQRSLQSKFLHYSITDGDSADEPDASVIRRPCDVPQLHLAGPLLPEPSIDENVPEPNHSHVFNRNVVWTFEDIRMLIGTDMPIFGSANRPCISLRLRDMKQPINVLTGIDYWLDNLMCNVPEVVMCYHLDGLVQKYELIPTEDLPNLQNSKFSPKLIRNVAQNVLAFLKQNATKAGHTYWLFKGRNDDFVKLYDLTSLCMNSEETNGQTNGPSASASTGGQPNKPKAPAAESQPTGERPEIAADPQNDNPFIVPVAMLLYKVARNMKNMSQDRMSAKQAGSIKTLLTNCIQLLPKEKYPQIVTSSHYILSDLHVPVGINPNAPDFNWSPETEEEQEEDRQSTATTDSHSDCDEPSCSASSTNEHGPVATKSISETLNEFDLQANWKHNASPPPIVGGVRERCETALQHIVEGLGCLQYFSTTVEKLSQARAAEERAERIRQEEQNPQMANSRHAIPLPYGQLQPEPQRADAGQAIPMGWKAEQVACKRNGQRKPTANDQRAIAECSTDAGDSPRALLLHGKSGVIQSWHVHLKLLLLEKACLTYATLAEQSYTDGHFGDALRHVQMAMQCQLVVTKYMRSVSSQNVCLLGRAGDCYFQLSKSATASGASLTLDENLHDFAQGNRTDKAMRAELAKDLESIDEGADIAALLPDPGDSVEGLMVRSCACYERALVGAQVDARREFLGRLGSVRNELGVKYMHWAQQEYVRYIDEQKADNKKDETSGDSPKEPLYQVFIKKSYDCLVRGIGAFEEIEDNANLAILMCNMGRFMRFRAHVIMIGESDVDIGLKRKFYDGAFSSYQRALGILEMRKRNPVLWDLVNWELSTGTFTLAQHMIDNTPDERWSDGTEQEILDLLLGALKLCDVDTPGERQVPYAFRQASIYHRLADVYGRSYRRACCATEADLSIEPGADGAGRRKKLLQLCRMYYEKAARVLEPLEQTVEYLQVQFDRMLLQEYLASACVAPSMKIRHLQQTLDILRLSRSIVMDAALDSGELDERLQRLLADLVRHVQGTFKMLIKLCMGQQQQAKSSDVDTYKRLYSLTLRRPENAAGPSKTSSDLLVLRNLIRAL